MTPLKPLGWPKASIAGDLSFPPATAGAENTALRVARGDLWSRRIEELLTIRSYEDDWDGQGAKSPSTKLVESALILAETFRQGGVEAPSRIVLGVNGTVIFEWQAGEDYCEIEVTRPSHAEGLRLVPGRSAEHWVIEAE